MPTATASIEQLSIDTIRTLSMDAVEAAASGHPGTPMALAPVSYALWTQRLKYDPAAPLWPNRDRYVLSCGHASMLLYSLIHLSGIKHCEADGRVTNEPALSLEELKNFRQWGSRTPGHPEYGHATGVETTTGPLGQGCGNSVGMAMAGKWLADRYNKPSFEIFDYNVFVQCSDGDLMEGVACEAASLAGHLGLDNLCWIYDDNGITIEGQTELAFSEDVEQRFKGLGWHVIRLSDANDVEKITQAFDAFLDHDGQPTLIIAQTEIGYGAPNKAGTAAAHGAPLGEEEVRLTKEAYGWDGEKKFVVPDEVPEHFSQTLGARGSQERDAWQQRFTAYEQEHPQLAAEIKQVISGDLPSDWDADLPSFDADAKGMATRKSSGQVLNALAANVPWLIGGSADLAPSNNTLITDEKAGHFGIDNPGGRNLHFGVREHGMAAAGNGMALCGIRPYLGTFFVFTDYMRPSMRLAGLMQQPVTYVLTHDSIGLGEDGPTHQPIEHLAAARAIPNLVVIRPADANEVREAWKVAVQSTSYPVALVLTRQNVPTFDRSKFGDAVGLQRGGYVLADCESGKPDVLLMSTGSEVQLALAAFEKLSADGVQARVVSMPSFELFELQDESYQNEVLPHDVTARVAVEAGIRQGWDRYLGSQGKFIGLETFGASAPYQTVYEKLGITSDAVVKAAQELLP